MEIEAELVQLPAHPALSDPVINVSPLSLRSYDTKQINHRAGKLPLTRAVNLPFL